MNFIVLRYTENTIIVNSTFNIYKKRLLKV